MLMKSSAWRVGLFALAGLIASALVIVLVGERWFTATERAQMRFDSSVFGLRTGAPVVFRGVRVGQVNTIGFAAMAGGGLAIPVTAEFEREALRELLISAGGQPTGQLVGSNVIGLIGRGLVARLALQSILTGQLYVDLDFDASRVKDALPTPPTTLGSLPLIPTAQSKLQTLQAQLEGLDLAQIGRDVAAIAASARQLLAGPGPARVLDTTADAAMAMQRLAANIDAAVGPLSRAAQATLAQSQLAIGQIGAGAQQAGLAASQVGATAVQAQTLLTTAGPVLAELQRTAVELGRVANTLREAADADSPLRQSAERALQDVSRAARALGELGETLNRQPDALLRGRMMSP